MGKRFSDKGGNEKKAFLVLSKRGGKERTKRDTNNARVPCYPSLHSFDLNVKMGEDHRDKLPLLAKSLKQKEIVFLFPTSTL